MAKHWQFLRILQIYIAVLIGVNVHTTLADPLPETFSARHRDFFALLNPGLPDISTSAAYRPGNDASNGPGSFDLQEYKAHSDFALPVARDLYFRFGGDYDLRVYDFSAVRGAAASLRNKTLHALSVTPGAGLFVTDNFLVTGFFRPGAYSDFSGGIDSNDFRYYARGFAAYRLNPGAMLIGGLLYDETFDDAPLLPIAGLRLQDDTGKLQVGLTFPYECRVGYNLDPNAQLYGGYWISGDAFQAKFGKLGSTRIQVQDQNLGFGGTYWLSQNFSVGAEIGLSLNSEFKIKEKSPGQFTNGDLDTAPYFQLSLGVSL